MIMNRIELIGMFTAMKELAKSGNVEGLEKVLDVVLDEAKQAGKFENQYGHFTPLAPQGSNKED